MVRALTYGLSLVLLGVLLGGCAAARPASPNRAELYAAGLSFPRELTFTSLSGAELGASAALADDDGDGLVHGILLYIPNRIFDLLDIVRLRARVGPGLAFDIRATEALDFFLGAYVSFFIGIPGPRLEPVINWPFGMDSKNGAEISIIDASAEAGDEPQYGIAEFGIGAQVLIIGADVGVDPWEAVDFLAGIITIDPVHDDL
jgi:hypothetical protein